MKHTGYTHHHITNVACALTESSAHAMNAHPPVNGSTSASIVYLRPILSIRYPIGITATAAPSAIKEPTHAQSVFPSLASSSVPVGEVHASTVPSANAPNVTAKQYISLLSVSLKQTS